MSILTLDVGGTFIKYTWMNEQGNITGVEKEPTPRTNQKDFIHVIKKIWDANKEEKNGIAISLPGTIDPITGFVYQGGSLTYNHQSNLKGLLEEVLQTNVSIENDARCAAIAERSVGNMMDITNGIVLVFGTGVGGCLILNHELYRGSHLFAGEVSMLICKDLSKYGIQGVFGNVAGIPLFAQRLGEQIQQPGIDGVEAFELIKQRNQIALDMFQSYCKDVVTQLFNLQVLFDPQRICIGGGVSAEPQFIEGIKQAMDAFYERLPIPMPHLDIQPCKFQNDANLLGAYYHFKELNKAI